MRKSLIQALCVVVPAAALLILPPFARGQGQRPVAQFRAGIELMRLQVSVTRKGEHVAGLSTDDFMLQVNDTDRPVELVVEVDLDSPAPTADQSTAAEDTAWRRRYYMPTRSSD